jgi:RNA polymerase sigma-70 factor (ECF subfamily)
MAMESTFSEFLRRIRAGDADAAAELVRRYEPIVRREARLRLTDPILRSLFDSSDFSQSVLRSFFVRAALGQYDLRRPEDLRNLLVRMARNKVAGQARRLRRRPADARREGTASVEALTLLSSAPGPEQQVGARDLLHTVLRELPEQERHLAELRMAGQTWPQISALLGGTAVARRKQLARALDRVVDELGLEEEHP